MFDTSPNFADLPKEIWSLQLPNNMSSPHVWRITSEWCFGVLYCSIWYSTCIFTPLVSASWHIKIYQIQLLSDPASWNPRSISQKTSRLRNAVAAGASALAEMKPDLSPTSRNKNSKGSLRNGITWLYDIYIYIYYIKRNSRDWDMLTSWPQTAYATLHQPCVHPAFSLCRAFNMCASSRNVNITARLTPQPTNEQRCGGPRVRDSMPYAINMEGNWTWNKHAIMKWASRQWTWKQCEILKLMNKKNEHEIVMRCMPAGRPIAAKSWKENQPNQMCPHDAKQHFQQISDPSCWSRKTSVVVHDATLSYSHKGYKVLL